MNQSANDNNELKRRPSIKEVDDLAMDLCQQFNNHDFFRWYCSAIWKLGIARILEIRGRVSDARMPGHLFTKLLREEIRKHDADETIKRMFRG